MNIKSSPATESMSEDMTEWVKASKTMEQMFYGVGGGGGQGDSQFVAFYNLTEFFFPDLSDATWGLCSIQELMLII